MNEQLKARMKRVLDQTDSARKRRIPTHIVEAWKGSKPSTPVFYSGAK
jgi:hypothetical protein